MILILTAIVINSQSAPAVSKANELDLAKQLIKNGKSNQAFDRLSHYLKENPKSSEGHQLRGWLLYYLLRKPELALAELDKAIALDPRRYENLVCRGEVYRELARYDESRAELDKAMKLQPARPEAYYLHGLTCLLQGMHIRAKQDFTDAIKRAKKNQYLYYAYYWRGRTEDMQGDFRAAVQDFSQCIAMNPGTASQAAFDPDNAFSFGRDDKRSIGLGLLERGLCYGSLGEHENAIKDLTVVLKSSPKENLLYEKRGNSYLALGRYQDALKDFNRTLLLGSESGDVYFNLGLAHFCLKRYESTASDFKAWLGRTFWDDKKAPLAASLSHLCFLRLNQSGEAKAIAREAQQKLAKSDGVGRSVALLLNDKMTPEALVQSTNNKSIKEKTQAHCYAGLYLSGTGKTKEAARHFNWVKVQGDKSLDEFTISAAQADSSASSN